MDTIKVSDKILKEKPKYTGYESHIYELDGFLLKVFHTDEIAVLNNKQAKLEILHSLDIEDVKPIYLAEINGKIKGYFMEELSDYQVLDLFQEKDSNKLETLKIILEKLKVLHQNNIVFGDMNLNNILVKGDSICFCDLDNAKIDSFDFDVLNYCQQLYLKVFDSDKYLDNYLFNLLTISYLKKFILSSTPDYIRFYPLPFSINTKENRQIVKKMIKLDQKEAIEPFMEHTKRYHLF